MTLRLDLPRCLLVIAPHADDETIGAFGLIVRCRRRGIAVRVVVASDGAASHPASIAWPRRRLVTERRRETRRAMRRLGVGAAALSFLSLPDGRLGNVPVRVGMMVGQAIRRAPRPLLVVAPLVSDDHADHRAVAAAVAATRDRGVRVLGYPVWPAGAATPSRGLRIVLTARERLAKRFAIRSYRTQAGRITDDPSGFAMTGRQIAAFSRPAERFVEVLR